MKCKVLVSAPYMQPIIDRFGEIFEHNQIEVVLPLVKERFEEVELLKFVADIDCAICRGGRFKEKVLLSAPKLEVISKRGTGIDSIDETACRRLGIQICNTPNAFSGPVADTVFGYSICFARNLPCIDRTMRKCVRSKTFGRALRECTLCVIGVGNIGKTVVRRARAFSMKLLGNDIIDIPKTFLEETDLQMVSKDALLQEADFVTFHCDFTPNSYYLLTLERFMLTKPSAAIINTARGPVINEKDLVLALEAKIIASAALDVLENEPLLADSPLVMMDNVMLARHNTNSSPEAWEKVYSSTI
jgi:D-3-phosphoglycerate dehydrogenase